jgi:hypothetical protein
MALQGSIESGRRLDQRPGRVEYRSGNPAQFLLLFSDGEAQRLSSSG